MERVSAEDGNESARLDEGAETSVTAGDRDRLMTVHEEGVVERYDDELRRLDDEAGQLVSGEAERYLHELAVPDAEDDDAGFDWVLLVGVGEDDDEAETDVADAARQFLAEQDRWSYMTELLDKARAGGFRKDRPYWNAVATAVAQYALGVLKGWIMSGRLWFEVATIGWSVAPNDMQARLLVSDPQAREVLANEIVFSALRRWRKLEIAGAGWDQNRHRGAALRTWFVRLCVRDCPNAFRRWSRTHKWRDREALETTEGEFGFDTHNQSPMGESPLFEDPLPTTVNMDELARAVARLKLSPTQCQVIALKAYRYTVAEIAALVAMPEDDVRNLLRRLRYRSRQSGWNSS